MNCSACRARAYVYFLCFLCITYFVCQFNGSLGTACMRVLFGWMNISAAEAAHCCCWPALRAFGTDVHINGCTKLKIYAHAYYSLLIA